MSRPNSPRFHGYTDVCYLSPCNLLGRISQPIPAGYIAIHRASPGTKGGKELDIKIQESTPKDVWAHEDFIRLADEDDDEGIGTHSCRKFPSTYARLNGCTLDEIEI